jgi:hypothetical protein
VAPTASAIETPPKLHGSSAKTSRCSGALGGWWWRQIRAWQRLVDAVGLGLDMERARVDHFPRQPGGLAVEHRLATVEQTGHPGVRTHLEPAAGPEGEHRLDRRLAGRADVPGPAWRAEVGTAPKLLAAAAVSQRDDRHPEVRHDLGRERLATKQHRRHLGSSRGRRVGALRVPLSNATKASSGPVPAGACRG